MNQDEILSDLHPLFQKVLDQKNLVLKRATTADQVENWDSLAHIDLVSAIERKFKIKFTLKEIQSLQNVGEMIDLIQKKTS